MDTIFSFAKNLANVKYEHIPKTVVDVCKMEILDTLGVALAGSVRPNPGLKSY